MQSMQEKKKTKQTFKPALGNAPRENSALFLIQAAHRLVSTLALHANLQHAQSFAHAAAALHQAGAKRLLLFRVALILRVASIAAAALTRRVAPASLAIDVARVRAEEALSVLIAILTMAMAALVRMSTAATLRGWRFINAIHLLDALHPLVVALLSAAKEAESRSARMMHRYLADNCGLFTHDAI